MSNADKDRQVNAKLDEIEAEMKRIGFWSAEPPEFTATSFLDAPSFELWLQCVLVPHGREAAQTGDYPESSQVGLMAMRQYDYHSYVEEAQTLLQLLYEFDEIVNAQ